MKCIHCNKEVVVDQDEDLIHVHLENKGVDPRLCDPIKLESIAKRVVC